MTTPGTSRELDTPAEVAKRYRVSLKTIYRRCADGTLPTYRVGRQLRIDLAAAEAAFTEASLR